MLKYQTNRTWRWVSWVEKYQEWLRMPNQWGQHQTGAHNEQHMPRVEMRLSGIRISNSHATPWWMYLRCPHLLWSVPDGPLRLLSHSINENNSNWILEKSFKPTHLPRYTVTLRLYWVSLSQIFCSLYMNWTRCRCDPRHNMWTLPVELLDRSWP